MRPIAMGRMAFFDEIIVNLDAAVTYLSGGPAPILPVKVRYRVEARGIEFADYSDFRFGGRPVKEGVVEGSLDGGARFDRHVEFVGADGKPRVRARTTWAILDKATGRPLRVPPEVAAPFLR